MIQRSAFLSLLFSAVASLLLADETPSSMPKPIPATRPEMKAALEALKDRQPRLPLPPKSQDDQGVNNGRMRADYLPAEWGGGGVARIGDRDNKRRLGQDPNAMLDYLFTVPCFWVVSRGNNCHYCLGHQELKLRAAGMPEDTIASLDCDWSQFDPRQQAALTFARRLTLEPEYVGDDDIAKLKEVLSDPEIIELAFTIARFNATNRWTDGMGLPQDRQFSDDRPSLLTTPTSEPFQHRKSIVIPTTRKPRHPVATLEQTQQAISANRSRAPRVGLPTVTDARRELADVIGDRAPYEWERALAALPVNGKVHVKTWNTVLADENLPPRLKAEIAFITAVNNQAWYAAAHAAHRLKQLGASPKDLTSLLGEQEPSKGGAAAAYHLAAKSTSDPHLVTDADVAFVRESFSDRETAEIMQVICLANLFDRFTESLGLPVEDNVAGGATLSQR
jgi:alkylhydroperoxidase family enzyme